MKDQTVSFQMNSKVVHALIGIAIMFIVPLLPIPYPDGTVTEVGRKVLGVFAGTLYLWTTTDPVWSSILSAVMIGFSGYTTMGGLLAEWFGNQVLVQMFFMMVLTGALVHEKVTHYIGRFFLTRKIVNGRPWVFTVVIVVGSFCMSVFMGCFMPILLFWPVMNGVYEDVGFKKTDKYPKLLTILIVVGALVGFPVPPYMSNGLALLTNYRNISEGACVINDGAYFVTYFILGLVICLAAVAATRFVLRPDVTPLRSITVEQLDRNPLPPMNLRQKLTLGVFALFVALMLIPSLLSGFIPFMALLSSYSFAWPVILCALASAAILSDGKPILNLPGVMATNFNWATFFIVATAILLGSVLTNQATGVAALLGSLLGPIFQGMSPVVFTVALLLITFVLTNVCNSLVIGMLMQPIILTYANTTGINAAPIVTLMIFFVLMTAMLTPSASPFAAMMFANKEMLKSTDVYKYTAVYAVVEIVLVLLVGIPFSNLMMG